MARARGNVARNIRGALVFAAGLAGLAYETLIDKQRSPELILGFIAMLGLPAFDWIDRRGSGRDDPGQ